MRPDERNAALLWDMVTHAREVRSFVASCTFEQYRENRVLKLAVERLVQIIGEAASQVSREFREATSHIPWVPIISQRHRLVHEYGVIDDGKIWRVATIHVVELIPQLEALMPEPPEDPSPEPPQS